jgi:catalase
VPGIDFSNDPLLQGRLFSYLDTQLSRLGSPNFHEIPINRPKCPWANLQRDGHMRQEAVSGRVNYEPNSLAPEGPRADPHKGFSTYARPESGDTMRVRPESFADHYTQARLFFISQTPPEQDHLVSALVFELSKVETPHVRATVVSHLMHIDKGLAERVAKGLRLTDKVAPAETTSPAKEGVTPSPALSIIGKAKPTIHGRVVGCLVSDGTDQSLVAALRQALEKEGAKLKVVAPHVGGFTGADGATHAADMRIDGGPSVIFDAVAVLVSADGGKELAHEFAAVNFVADAFNHLKVIGHTAGAEPLMQRAGVKPDEGILALGEAKSFGGFIAAAKKMRVWAREKTVRIVP